MRGFYLCSLSTHHHASWPVTMEDEQKSDLQISWGDFVSLLPFCCAFDIPEWFIFDVRRLPGPQIPSSPTSCPYGRPAPHKCPAPHTYTQSNTYIAIVSKETGREDIGSQSYQHQVERKRSPCPRRLKMMMMAPSSAKWREPFFSVVLLAHTANANTLLVLKMKEITI